MEHKADYFQLRSEYQADLLNEAFRDSQVQTAILEKDIWVCVVLRELFRIETPIKMVFKGGTSLSKVYKAISRFSEDIDITVDWGALRPTPILRSTLKEMSKTQRSKLSDEINAHLESHVENVILPALRSNLAKFCDATVDFETDHSNTMVKSKLRVRYNAVAEDPSPYLAASVLLEFGARNDIEPGDETTITTDLAALTEQVDLPIATVVVLAPERTFWEKATLIHDECRRPGDKVRANASRRSRHWYDLSLLAPHEIGRNALERGDLLEAVIEVKELFFSYQYSDYKKCKTGAMQLVPHDPLLSELRNDYEAMLSSGMLYGDPPTFDKMIENLRTLESEINSKFAAPMLVAVTDPA